MNPDTNEVSNEFFKKLNQQIVQKDNLIKLLQLQIRNLKNQIDASTADSAQIEELKSQLESKASDIESLQTELSEQKKMFSDFENEKNSQVEELSRLLEEHQSDSSAGVDAGLEEENQQLMAEAIKKDERISDLSDELASIKDELKDQAQKLKDKDQELKNSLQDFEEERKRFLQDIEALKRQSDDADETHMAELASENALLESRVKELETELNNLEKQSEENSSLKEQVANLKTEAATYVEAAMKLTALETERERLSAELLEYKKEGKQLDAMHSEIVSLRSSLHEKESEIATYEERLRNFENQSAGLLSVESAAEIEDLTSQVADQLLAIQNFETAVSESKAQIEEQKEEIERLRETLRAYTATASEERPIDLDSESELVTGLIDFFDGLEAIIKKNPIPELQALHQRLLDRLIMPNRISSMEVISETFDPSKHFATDYFRSDKFPEKCIVFEVEKGYLKGERVIKKAGVWVVQNLYECPSCGTMQTKNESKYCHMCGTKITAPNGLAVDSLPEFEPKAATYKGFADRALRDGDIDRAKEYILEGLDIDGKNVPLLVNLADIHQRNSEFQEARDTLSLAYSLKPDAKIKAKIDDLETRLSIFSQAKSLKLSAEEFDKLLDLIQK